MRIIIVLLLLAGLVACGRTKTAPVTAGSRVFVSGVYATFEKGRYCVSWDTILVSRSASQSNLYHIVRRTTYQRNLGDDFFPAERVTTIWTAIYDEGSRILSSLGRFRNIQFIPDQNTLVLAGSSYPRVE